MARRLLGSHGALGCHGERPGSIGVLGRCEVGKGVGHRRPNYSGVTNRGGQE